MKRYYYRIKYQYKYEETPCMAYDNTNRDEALATMRHELNAFVAGHSVKSINDRGDAATVYFDDTYVKFSVTK